MKLLKISTIIILFILVVLTIFIHLNFFSSKEKIYKRYPNLNIRKYLFSQEPIFNKIDNDYNVKFLPNTELIKLNLVKKKIKFKKNYYTGNPKTKKMIYGTYGSFFIDIFEDDLIIIDYLGNSYFSKIEYLLNKKNSLNIKYIENNLKEKNIERVYDVLIDEQNIYVAFVEDVNQCRKIVISKAEINSQKLNFDDLFVSKTCHKSAGPGRMQIYNFLGEKGILISISSGSYNDPSLEAQQKDNIYGKTVFFNLQNKRYSIFSLGHRVIQGLSVNKDLILATEHGPRGGDEINVLKENHNYGWPIASYGEKYDFKYNKNPFFKKDHFKHGFQEPIYSFFPAIGISEIIKLPNEFSKMHQNVFIVSSLYGKSIFLVKLNNENNGIVYSEKIFLNERIRDLKYDEKNEIILLAFEENGELGILAK